LPCGWLITGTDGKPMNEPPHPVLAQGKVRHVGDQIALVIAETPDQAKDAAEAIVVDYDVLPAVVNCVDALKPGAPQIHDGAPGNKCYTWALGDKAAVDAAFAKAEHVSKLDIVNNRLDPECDRAARRRRVVQPRRRKLHALRRQSESARRAPADDRPSCSACPSTRCASSRRMSGAASARRSTSMPKRPRWCGRRSASIVPSNGRPSAAKASSRTRTAAITVTHVELACTKDGKFLAMRVHTTAAMGAYLSTFASCIPTILYATLLAGQYAHPSSTPK
jgi:carbon-monoxide dehydrogenase large subunit